MKQKAIEIAQGALGPAQPNEGGDPGEAVARPPASRAAAAPYFENHDRRLRFPWSLYHSELSERLAVAIRRLAVPRPRVLVVGCGLEPFVAGVLGPVWHGADLDEASIERCRQRYPELADRLDVCPDPYRLPSAGPFARPFDAIVAKEVIEHLPDPERFARQLASRLAPGGELLLTTPNYGALSSLALLERTVLELVARFDGYSRRDIHPSRFDRRRLAALRLPAEVELQEIHSTRTGWALFGRWQRVP